MSSVDYSQNSESQYVQSIDVYVTEEYGSKLYDSCKDVKFAATNTRAMDFVGGGASNYTGELVQSIFIERNGQSCSLFEFMSGHQPGPLQARLLLGFRCPGCICLIRMKERKKRARLNQPGCIMSCFP